GLLGEYMEAGRTDLLLAIDGVAFGLGKPPLVVVVPRGDGDKGDNGVVFEFKLALEPVVGVDRRRLLDVDNRDDMEGIALNDGRFGSFVVLLEPPTVDIVKR
ncbi:hypothetical protein V5O48_019532, partial [Marasmius crinis-equi]